MCTWSVRSAARGPAGIQPGCTSSRATERTCEHMAYGAASLTLLSPRPPAVTLADQAVSVRTNRQQLRTRMRDVARVAVAPTHEACEAVLVGVHAAVAPGAEHPHDFGACGRPRSFESGGAEPTGAESNNTAHAVVCGDWVCRVIQAL